MDALTRMTEERDRWKAIAKRAGVCMTCALAAPEPFGCTDCLNTGWERRDPDAPRVFTLGHDRVIVASLVSGGVPTVVFGDPVDLSRPPVLDDIFDGESFKPGTVVIELPNLEAATTYIDAAANAVKALEDEMKGRVE